jgi:hypothetical protein
MLGAVSPFRVEPEDEDEGGLVDPVPTVDPPLAPKLELPRGSSGSSSLQAAVNRSARANVGLVELVRVRLLGDRRRRRGLVVPGCGGGEAGRDRTKREPVAGISKNQALKWFSERNIIPSVL